MHDVVEESEGVQKLVEMIKLGPDHPTHRAVQVLSWSPWTRRSKTYFEMSTRGVRGLRAMLRDPAGSILKHAALTNHLCDENVPNKIAFLSRAACPP